MIFESEWRERDFKVLGPDSPAYRKWARRTSSQAGNLRTDLVGGFEVNVAWRNKVKAVWTTRSWVCSDDTEEKLGYTPEEDDDGLLALVHSYIACRLVCKPMAGRLEASSCYFEAAVKNKQGVTFGDVLYALAKQ